MRLSRSPDAFPLYIFIGIEIVNLFILFLAALMVAVEIEFYGVADKIRHFLRSGKHILCKAAVYFGRNIGRVPCFNVEPVEQGAFAYPFGKAAVKHCCLFA